MRFTPSTNWTAAARAASRIVRWTMEIKKTTSISDALSSGSWVDVSSYTDGSYFPISQRIEFSVGQFSSDSVTVTASFNSMPGLPEISAVQFFENNIFNASASQYLEVRIKGYIGLSVSTLSSDVFYAFTGFIDKANVTYGERGDSAIFSVFTADDLGNRIASDNISTQYVNDDVDGSGTDGLVLPQIPGIFVVDAAIASYELKAGQHTIEYEYNASSERARLDGGAWVTLTTSDGIDTLISEDGLEKVDVFIIVSDLSQQNETLTDYILVTSPGTTLPQQPFYGLSLRYLLKNIYSKIGITDFGFDTLQFSTFDGNPKISFYDTPPQDASKTGKQYAAVDNGTDMFISVGDTVYKRTMATDSYSTVTTKASYTVYRLWYNARNNHLWIWFVGASDTYVRIYDLSNSTYNEVSISNNTNYRAAELVDYSYTAGLYMYGIVYINNSGNDIRMVDSSATDSQLFSAAALGVNAVASYVFTKNQNVYFHDNDGINLNFHKISIDVSGTWNDDGSIFTLLDSYNSWAAYHKSEERIYYYNVAGGKSIKSHSTSAAAVTTVSSLSAGDDVQSMMYLNSVVYFTLAAGTNYYKGSLYSLASNTQTLVHSLSNGPHQRGFAMMYFGSTLYGVDILKRLWRYSSTLNMYVNRPAFSGSTVRDALVQALQAYNLIGIISANKKAFIYRRGDDAGDIQTTGNILSLDKSDVVDIRKIQNAFQAIGWVEVTNGTTTWNYDGSDYQTTILSDSKTLSISNPLIPDDLVIDVCKNDYEFYKLDHDVYEIQTNIANMEYEVMDGATVAFTDTRIQKSGTGLIQSFSFDSLGNITPEVLF
jgi:hypothetical protein